MSVVPTAIRPFTPDDIAQVRSLWQRTEGVALSEGDEPAALTAFLDRNRGLSFVARDGEALAGAILCGTDGRRGYIYHLAVAPEYRRRGLGRRLLRACVSALRSEGVRKCHLFVFKTNDQGLAFWRRVGAEERVSLALFSIRTGGAA